MPNNNEKGTFENRKAIESWKPPSWLEPAFIYTAFTVAAVSFVALLLWILVTFVVPFNIYSKETEEIVLTNGQTLQIKYPNLVLAGDTPGYISLILSGESNATNPATFFVAVPSGLTVVEPTRQAQSKNLELTTSDLGSTATPISILIGVVNSNSVNGVSLFKRYSVEVNSSSMPFPQKIGVGVETIFWKSIRTIVNNTINEESSLILMLTGFLSGAGTLVLQNMKTHRDRIRKDMQRKEKKFREDLDKEPLETLYHFVNLTKGPQDEWGDFLIYKSLVEWYGWENKLQQIILMKLKSSDIFDARRAANVLRNLCETFDHGNETVQTGKFGHSISLAQVCDLVCVDDPKIHKLTSYDAQCLLNVLTRWQDLKPLITNLIHGFSYLPANLPIISENLATENKGQLLRDANIQQVIDGHIGRLRTNPKANSVILTTAEYINDLLVSDLQWRDIRSRKEKILSDKVQRWLSGHIYESVDANFSLGSEYAELDSELKEPELEHPVFKQANHPLPIIVFGDEGMGKTVSALWLAGQHRKLITTGVFPVYAPFESEIDLTHWTVEKIARALVNFVADNPQKFISASDSHKTAMGRLMIWHAQSVDTLRLNLYSSPFVSSSNDIDQVLDHIKKFAPKKSSIEPSGGELLNLLFLARPDIFDQTFFLWDIRSSSPHEEVIGKIREMATLAGPLARQNIFIKIFAPLTVKQFLGNLGVIRPANNDLTWSESQIRELVEKKLDKFAALWDKSVEDPVGLIVSEAKYSPRRLMNLLIRLVDHVDEYLKEGEKFNTTVFREIAARQLVNGDFQAHRENYPESVNNYNNAVFISYAWGGESERIVNEVERAFEVAGIPIVRDKKDLDYKGSIDEFEKRIGRGQCVILVISDKYLRSEHCMYELILVDENQRLRDRIFPIVLTDAGIYQAIDRLQYIKYWDDKIDELNLALKGINVMTNLTNIITNLEKYARIRASFDHLSDLLNDMNALTPEAHSAQGFSTIINAIKKYTLGQTNLPDNHN